MISSSTSPCLTLSPATSDPITVVVNDLPSVSAISGDITTCADFTNLSNETPDGVWSSSNTSIATVSIYGVVSRIEIGEAIITYTVTNENGCVASDAKTVSFVSTPASPDTIYGVKEVCSYVNQSTELIYHVTPVAGAATYDWYLPAGVNLVSGAGTDSIVVTIDNTMYNWAAIYVASVSANGCTSDYKSLWIFKTIPTLGAITGTTNVCAFTDVDTTIYYSVDAVTDVNTYTWEVPTGATIVSGQNTTTVGVKFTNSFVTGTFIKVTGVSNCGSSVVKQLRLVKLLPGIPVAISGITNACPYYNNGTSTTYTIDNVINATSYHWSLPPYVTLVGGDTTSTSITVQFDSGYVSSYIKVQAVTNCYSSGYRQIYVTAAPFSVPSIISGPTNPCIYTNTGDSATYTISKVTGALGYVWTMPVGATIASHPGGIEDNDTIIKVTFPLIF
jgi:hypothetical protein